MGYGMPLEGSMGGYPTPWYGAPAAAGEEVAPILGLAEPLSSVREVCGAARGLPIYAIPTLIHELSRQGEEPRRIARDKQQT